MATTALKRKILKFLHIKFSKIQNKTKNHKQKQQQQKSLNFIGLFFQLMESYITVTKVLEPRALDEY